MPFGTVQVSFSASGMGEGERRYWACWARLNLFRSALIEILIVEDTFSFKFCHENLESLMSNTDVEMAMDIVEEARTDAWKKEEERK
ncbi:hypothetical protein TIFTF001_041971 [Ficus carica]|uniref:Uncharacterized protein n=1 Tax=Ficus carica TaxID=3494 RepID=A0AA87ZKR0_FICCA|nr:hypothetical protein TIFTF001_041971 [Ficus carica]